MKKILTPPQIKRALKTANIRAVSKLCGVGYTTCHKLSTYDGNYNYNKKTLEKISDYLLKEYEDISVAYGFVRF